MFFLLQEQTTVQARHNTAEGISKVICLLFGLKSKGEEILHIAKK